MAPDSNTSEALQAFTRAILNNAGICGTRCAVDAFPEILYQPYLLDRIGVIVCQRGYFRFTVNQKDFACYAGQSVFLSSASTFCVQETSEDMQVYVLFYTVEPIRDALGSTVMTMRLYSLLSPGPCDIWTTGQESQLVQYISLLSAQDSSLAAAYSDHEQKLLLMAITYRLCSIYAEQLDAHSTMAGRKMEIFVKLVELIETHYIEHRDVQFYADALCLSPKYLSSLVKSICGYTVQEMVFKALLRRSIFLMKNTTLNVQQVAAELCFPTASSFGTFFKKHTGKSPMLYRMS